MTDYMVGIDLGKVRRFRLAAARYYRADGRKLLAWRLTRDPWKILLAEMLLRKTTALQAEPVYRVLSRMSPRRLRTFDRRALGRLLRPLGMQNVRTRLLIAVAEQVVRAGRPRLADRGFLLRLPGVGPYAANMVLAGAFGLACPGLDRNMIRVIERVFSVRSLNARPHTDPRLWEAAERIMPRAGVREFNWAVLDVGASFCRPQKPRCASCPFRSLCEFAGRDLAQRVTLSARGCGS